MWKEVAIAIGLPVLRSSFGWAVKALEDEEVTLWEWKQLASTVLRVSFISVVAYFGINALGIDVGVLGTTCGAVLFDMVVRAVKKKK